jgi:hypothetical protein
VTTPATAATPATTAPAPGPFEVDGRPAPAPKAPPREALHSVYVELLAIEQERLRVAVRIERERGFVFPETSVIVRDVRSLAEKVYGPGAAAEGTGEGAKVSDPAGAREGSAGQPARGRARGAAPGRGGAPASGPGAGAGFDDLDSLLDELGDGGELEGLEGEGEP